MIVGIGVDVVDIARVERMLEAHGDRLVNRMLTPDEAAYTATRADRSAAIAVRLAAKEAAYKALTGTELARAIGWKDTEVFKNWDGAPSLRFRGRAETRAKELGVTRVLVSLTHSETSAVAFVVLERE